MNKPAVVFLLFSFLTCLTRLSADEIHEDIMAEIETSVLDKCALISLREGGTLDRYSDEELLTLVRAAASEKQDSFASAIYTVVKNMRSIEDRRSCIQDLSWSMS